ncbi:protein of unknown function [Taphrina deformans PYCC 5710]|uniref:Formyl transferase N-terminal domain-containing protein n=1 Tax=Taphrina deformans (strain PYCC 5710 / ATCC 11124 / CBS 356.35 / IMI 108563 / JCM 9778 / NBRC 8474) TaxID=1097556 RepID=R4XLR8_TAPDE|nr:protein of unknown function [Taphrina deformans PYCC 5710]|eukprot:CCG84240.1 protein of unknown function [Taphrina deformans PYCC 5710]
MLRETHLRRADIISDLRIITPVSKRSGRGLSVLKEAPLTILARKTKYEPVHVTSFNLRPEELPPGQWDLIIAVSFGHKIGPEVLQAMSHGGLNVHPSILPRYRGPAPLHHALLNNDHETGVSIQTIHPTKFDQGEVLMQSPPIPLAGLTLDHLHGKTAMIGATMLRDLLYGGYPANAPVPLKLTLEPSQAPKIDKSAMEVDWSTWPVAKLVRWSSVFDSLWTRLDGRIVKLKDLRVVERGAGPDEKVGTIEILESPDADIKRQLQVRRQRA